VNLNKIIGRVVILSGLLMLLLVGARADSGLTLTFEPPHMLIIHGANLPGGVIRINYLEAYCRAGSTETDWVKHTVISHQVSGVELSADRKTLRLRDTLADGVTVDHTIVARGDEIDFRLRAYNPGATRSEAHWAQACVRLGDFTDSTRGAANSTTILRNASFFWVESWSGSQPSGRGRGRHGTYPVRSGQPQVFPGQMLTRVLSVH
jgi:hypothetical protein